MDRVKLERIIAIVTDEIHRSNEKHRLKWYSPHEGYGVLIEEVAEAFDEIRRDDNAAASKEMIQVAAMAIKFVYNFGD